MTDTLRTRIAAVLFALNAGEDWNMEPLVWEEISESYRKCWLKQADAVIRELGLRIQVAGPDGIVGTGDYRYVTEWETDD